MKKIDYLGYALVLSAFASGLCAQTAPAPSTLPPDSGTTPPASMESGPPSPSAESAVVLPSFQVNENADKGYLAGNSVSATRINTPISNLPFSISAFTPQFIADIDARELFSIVQFSAGVMSGSSQFFAGDTNFLIRGFNQFPEHDGFYESQYGNIYVDPVGIERVEVVKGPSSLLYGTVSPGGTVNYITKSAQPTPFVNFNEQRGSYDFNRVTLDINEPIVPDILLARLNIAYENGYQYVKPYSARTIAIDPTVTWHVTPKVSLKVDYRYFYREEDPIVNNVLQVEVSPPSSMVAALYNPGNPGPSAALTGKTGIDIAEGYGSDASNPGFAGFYPRAPLGFTAQNFNYANNNDYRTSNLQSVSAELDAALSSHWKARGNFDLAHALLGTVTTGQSQVYLAPPNTMTYANGAWSVSPSFSSMNSAQQTATELAFANQLNSQLSDFRTASEQLQNGVQAPAIVPERPLYETVKDNSHTGQLEVVGDYSFSWGNIKPLVGLFFDGNGVYTFETDNTGTAASPYERNWDIDPLSPTYYYNPYNTYSPQSLTNLAADTFVKTADEAAYAILNANFFDERLYLVGGVRYNASESQTTNFAAATNQVGEGYHAHAVTPQVGLGYKVLKDLLLYASVSKSYTPPSTAFLSTIETVNGTLESVPTTPAVPVTATGYEVGAKTDFLNGRISSTLSVYEIVENNLVQSINEFIGGLTLGLSVQQTQLTSKGVEFETTLSPTDNWQIIVSASEDDARNTEEPAGYYYYLGEPPAYFAKTLFNVWTRYSFKTSPLAGLWVGAGVNYTSKLLQDAANAGAFFAPFTLYSGIVGYDWNVRKAKLTAKIDVQNIGDSFYVPATQERGLPRHFIASISAAF